MLLSARHYRTPNLEHYEVYLLFGVECKGHMLLGYEASWGCRGKVPVEHVILCAD